MFSQGGGRGQRGIADCLCLEIIMSVMNRVAASLEGESAE